MSLIPLVSDIQAFYNKSTRGSNDATNKIREKILQHLFSLTPDYLEHPEHGPSWQKLLQDWRKILDTLATTSGVPAYTTIQTKAKGGRKFNYDFDILYFNGSALVATRHVEFKYGSVNIGGLPQFLSLQAKFGLFAVQYDQFWYDNYLDKYLACDLAITESKPLRDAYLKMVTSTRYTIHPFIMQLKDRELHYTFEKNTVVNNSIDDYITKYGSTLDTVAFEAKVKATQSDKYYILYKGGAFYLDMVTDMEMTGMTCGAIKNGNVQEVKAGDATYYILVRWRNHKGILNPALQIRMQRG